MAEFGHEVEGDVIGIRAGLPDQPEARRLAPVPRLQQPDQFLPRQRVVFADRPAILTGARGESMKTAEGRQVRKRIDVCRLGLDGTTDAPPEPQKHQADPEPLVGQINSTSGKYTS